MSDKRDIYFTDDRKQKAFQGDGYVLHDSRIVHNNPNNERLPPIPHGAKTETNDQSKENVSIHSSILKTKFIF